MPRTMGLIPKASVLIRGQRPTVARSAWRTLKEAVQLAEAPTVARNEVGQQAATTAIGVTGGAVPQTTNWLSEALAASTLSAASATAVGTDFLQRCGREGHPRGSRHISGAVDKVRGDVRTAVRSAPSEKVTRWR